MTKSSEIIKSIESNGSFDLTYIQKTAKLDGVDVRTYIRNYVKNHYNCHGNVANKVADWYC